MLCRIVRCSLLHPGYILGIPGVFFCISYSSNGHYGGCNMYVGGLSGKVFLYLDLRGKVLSYSLHVYWYLTRNITGKLYHDGENVEKLEACFGHCGWDRKPSQERHLNRAVLLGFVQVLMFPTAMLSRKSLTKSISWPGELLLKNWIMWGLKSGRLPSNSPMSG